MNRKDAQFRDGKINLIMKSDKTAFIIDALASQDRGVDENDPKGEIPWSLIDHIDKTKLF